MQILIQRMINECGVCGDMRFGRGNISTWSSEIERTGNEVGSEINNETFQTVQSISWS
jgi:hypothetical protein